MMTKSNCGKGLLRPNFLGFPASFWESWCISEKLYGTGYWLELLLKRLLDLPIISGVIPRASSRQMPILTYTVALKEFWLKFFFKKGPHCI